MIDYTSSVSDRDAMLTKIREELRAEHRRLTDVQIDLIADVAIELRMVRESVGKRVDARSSHAGVDESSSRS